jgi:multicomponent Na+:H+ antiporter subunit D
MESTYTSVIPLLAILVSLVAVPLILLSRGRPNVRESWTLLAAVAKFSLVVSLAPGALANHIAIYTMFDIAPGISLALRADAMGVFFALVSSGLWIVTSIYSIGYMRGLQEHEQTRYYASFAVCLSSTIGIALSANLLTFTLFYEILTIATYPLVIHKGTDEARAAGRKYLVYTLSAGVVLIGAVAWTYSMAGTLDFRAGGFLAMIHGTKTELVILFAMFIAAAGVKAGLMPLHSWLPAAMIAPTPVSALLHAVAVVKAGVFAVIRIVEYVFGPSTLAHLGVWNALAFIAGATIILSSVLAFRQDNLKRRLAYSTIGHLSYIILGAALLTPDALRGAILHLESHATMKITLFFCAGAIHVRLHKENISELDGIGRQMPFTMAAFFLASIGLIGIPPLNGFLSKWFLGIGTLEAHAPLGLVILLLSGLLNAGYFLPIVIRAFFKPPPDGVKYGEASWLMVGPLLLTALLSVVMGLAPDFPVRLFSLARETVTTIFPGGMP